MERRGGTALQSLPDLRDRSWLLDRNPVGVIGRLLDHTGLADAEVKAAVGSHASGGGHTVPGGTADGIGEEVAALQVGSIVRCSKSDVDVVLRTPNSAREAG